MTAEHFDFAIVGGGLVGAAIAFGLRRLGRQLVVLDEGDVAHRASRGNFGLIWVQGKGHGLPPYGSWTQRSAREWPRLAAELRQESGIDVALAQPGGLHVCLSRAELDRRVARLRQVVDQPGFERYDVDVLDRAAIVRRLPEAGPDVVGGTWTVLDGHCNPLQLLRALHAALDRAGCAYRSHRTVQRITSHQGDFRLETAQGSIEAQRIVLAAGLGNAGLAPMVGLVAPVRPNKGQVIVLDRVRPFLPFPIETIRQTAEGTVLIGDAQQDLGFDESLGIDVLATMAARAVRVFPFLRDVRVNRAWAALRVMSPDGFPIYAQSTTMPGAFVATCHSGVTLAAVHAFALAPAIATGTLPSSLEPFGVGRFDVPQAA